MPAASDTADGDGGGEGANAPIVSLTRLAVLRSMVAESPDVVIVVAVAPMPCTNKPKDNAR